MTSVIVWQDRECDRVNFDEPHVWEKDIWIAADSRISTPSDQHYGGRRVLTDVAPKVLPIRFELFERAEHGPGISRRFNGELGFAYAGNTLPATMTYAVVVSAFARLTGEYDSELPSLKDMIAFVARIGGHYARETGSHFELFVTGACPRDPQSMAQVWHLMLWSNDKPAGYHRLTFDAQRRMYLLGNRKDELRQLCRAGFAADISYNPTAALAELIGSSDVKEIGGLLMLARIDRHGGGITLFPGYGAAEIGGKSPATFDASLFGDVGGFEIGLNRW